MKFTDAKFLSAQEKERVFRVWRSFLKNRFKRTCFTKALYEHLHLHCGFIACYDIHGFYNTYFENPRSAKSFINAFIRQVSEQLPFPAMIECRDINSAMLKELHSKTRELFNELDQREVEMLKKQKQGIETRITVLRQQIEGD